MMIRSYEPSDRDGILALIIPIQQLEFGLAIDAADQPDLGEIPTFYKAGLGDFWIAEQSGSIIGTIALKDIGSRQGALRKMFVAAQARGPEHRVAARLLGTLIEHAKNAGLLDIFLGTSEKFIAAHRFYEKNGFVEIVPKVLPSNFPKMKIDRKFYRLTLA